MWDNATITMLLEGTRDTLYMTLVSTFFGYVLGLPLGILLAVTDKEGIHPNSAVYKVLDVIVNILRSIPDSPHSRHSAYETVGGQDVWIYRNDRTTCDCCRTVCRTYGRVLT